MAARRQWRSRRALARWLAAVSVPGVLTAVLATTPAMAAGPGDTSVAILPFEVEGDLPKGWEEKLYAALEAGVQQGGLAIIPPQEVLDATGGVGRCKNSACYRFVAETTGAEFLIRPSVRVRSRNYDVQLELVDGGSPDAVVSSSESCELCGLGEVEELVRAQGSVLHQKAKTLSVGPALVAIASTPPGAVVMVDGKKLGTTPLTRELPPGDHTVEVIKKGYIAQSRTIAAVKGAQESLDFELQADVVEDALPGTEPKWKRPARISGWTLLGVGVASLATGVTFFVLDERPYQGQCAGMDVDADGDCRRRWGTTLHGAVFTATGGALMATGLGLALGARKKRQRGKPEATARATIVPTVGLGASGASAASGGLTLIGEF